MVATLAAILPTGLPKAVGVDSRPQPAADDPPPQRPSTRRSSLRSRARASSDHSTRLLILAPSRLNTNPQATAPHRSPDSVAPHSATTACTNYRGRRPTGTTRRKSGCRRRRRLARFGLACCHPPEPTHHHLRKHRGSRPYPTKIPPVNPGYASNANASVVSNRPR